MEILGIEKLSLVDYSSYACAVIFTGGCNFFCPFCHNSGIVKKEVQTIGETEVLDFLKQRFGLLDAVVVSGGEPTLHKDLPEFLGKLKKIGYKVKLDTNGTNPIMLKKVVEEGLVDYVAMDIKNSFEKYPITTGLKAVDIEHIRESVEYLINGNIDYEFRTTLVEVLHESDDIVKMAEFLKGAKRLYLQKFVEADTCISQGLTPISKEKANEWKEILQRNITEVNLRGYV